jgi:hypothetical protein
MVASLSLPLESCAQCEGQRDMLSDCCSTVQYVILTRGSRRSQQPGRPATTPWISPADSDVYHSLFRSLRFPFSGTAQPDAKTSSDVLYVRFILGAEERAQNGTVRTAYWYKLLLPLILRQAVHGYCLGGDKEQQG